MKNLFLKFDFSIITDTLLVFFLLYFIIKYLIPIWLGNNSLLKKDKFKSDDIDSLIRQKERELTNLNYRIQPNAENKDKKNSWEMEIEKKITDSNMVNFYIDLFRKGQWDRSVVLEKIRISISQQCQKIHEYVQITEKDLRNSLVNSKDIAIHQGEFEKVVLFLYLKKWIEVLFHPLNHHAYPKGIFSQAGIFWAWRFTLLKTANLKDSHWQMNSIKNEDEFFSKFQKLEELLLSNSFSFFKSPKNFWEFLETIVYQLEVFYPLNDETMLEYFQQQLGDEREKEFQIGKIFKKLSQRFHPDRAPLELIEEDSKNFFLSLLEKNFQRLLKTRMILEKE